MTLDADWPEPTEITAYYERALEALDALALRGRMNAFASTSQFYGDTRVEFDGKLRAMRTELDREVSLALLASCEAMLRVDFLRRVKERRKQPRAVLTRFKQLHGQYGRRVPFEDILDAWKEHTGKRQEFAVLSEYLVVRHWLAHGRYWALRTTRRPDPGDVLSAMRSVFTALPSGDFPSV